VFKIIHLMPFSMPGIIILVTENYVTFSYITYQHINQLISYYKVFPNYTFFRHCVKQNSKSVK